MSGHLSGARLSVVVHLCLTLTKLHFHSLE